MEVTKIIVNKAHIKKVRYKNDVVIIYLKDDIFILHPGIASMRLLNSSDSSLLLLCLISIVFWAGVMMFLTNKSIKKHYFKMGGKKSWIYCNALKNLF